MNILRGWIGEKKTAFKLWLWLSSKKYHIYNDLILPSLSGTTQLDHLVVSQFGLFIIETKNKKGWIYGSEYQSTWTQTFYQKKFKFQNPLRQTFRQKKILAEFLEIEETQIYPIVYFVGRCKLKTALPANVMKSRLARYIKRFKKQIIPLHDLTLIKAVLENHRSESSITKRDHLYSLKRRHESFTHCPRCGSQLVLRTATKGAKVGSKFLGCSAFPKCRFTKEL